MKTSEEMKKEINHSRILLGYFSYPECSVCKVLLPKVEELLTGYRNVEFLYVDINHYAEMRGEYLVFAVPTIIIFENGREAKRFSRHFSLQDLSGFLDRITEKQVE